MRTRPARFDTTTRPCPASTRSVALARPSLTATLALALALSAGLGVAGPAVAEDGGMWEAPQRAAATTLDLLIVRPLAAARTGIGALLLVPATILASPGCAVNLVTGADCRPIFEVPYEVLVQEPAEYAFGRELGEL